MVVIPLITADKLIGVSLETKFAVNASRRRQLLHNVLFIYFMIGAF